MYGHGSAALKLIAAVASLSNISSSLSILLLLSIFRLNLFADLIPCLILNPKSEQIKTAPELPGRF